MSCHRNGTNTETTGGSGKGIGPGGVCCAGRNRVPRNAWIAVLLVVGLVLAAGIAKGAGGGWPGDIFRTSRSEGGPSAGIVETSDGVKIPLSSLRSGNALFLQADLGGREIHYIALQSGDGVYRAAFDACDVCFRRNRGYRQEGDLLVCNHCGQSFPSGKVNEVKGGCNPAPLPRTVQGDFLLIRKDDLAAGGPYFVHRRD